MEQEVDIQRDLDSLQDGETIELFPPGGEFAGPIVIDHPITLDGKGATIWALKGPVISIKSDKVSLLHLRIEVTGKEFSSPEDKCAVLFQSEEDLQFDDVEVRGVVIGIPEEEGEWKYPESLHLEHLAHGKEHDFLLRIAVPVKCKIITNISGLEFEPHHLNPGNHEIRLHLDKLPQDTLLDGYIFLASASLKRRIVLTARVLSLSDEQISLSQNSLVWEPQDWSSITETSGTKSQTVFTSNISPIFDTLDRLSIFLKNSEWKSADLQTHYLLLKSANCIHMGLLDKQAIDNVDINIWKIIDELWLKHSNKKFGFSIQSKIYQNSGNTPGSYDEIGCRKFVEKVGWFQQENRKKYSDFDFSNSAPDGHLPFLPSLSILPICEISLKFI
jgi:hypothetical protein